MRLFAALFAAVLALYATASVAQTCTFTVDAAPFPSDMKGRVAYIDEDNNLLYIYDFKTQARTQVTFTNSPAFTDIGNPTWTPDGAGLVFPAVQSDHWTLFFWKPGYAAAVPITTGGSRNEDPHFLVNGSKLVWKQDFGISTADVGYDGSGNPVLSNIVHVLSGSSGANELSGPTYTPTGKYIYFWKGVGGASQIWRYDTFTAAQLAFSKPAGIEFYYPATPDYYNFFYVRWADAVSQREQIFTYQGSTHNSIEWNAADCSTSKADPAPADEDYFVYSRITSGRYQLFLGWLGNGYSWSLPTANGASGGSMVGASYTTVQSP